MIVTQRDVGRTFIRPFEDNPPLVINTNAIKARQITLQQFQPISGRCPQIIRLMGIVQNVKFTENHMFQPGWNFSRPVCIAPVKQIGCDRIIKADYHRYSLQKIIPFSRLPCKQVS